MRSSRVQHPNPIQRSVAALIARFAGERPEGRPERGSALLATLMIITGLTLLGLGFVAITSTESAISVNQRNYTQTLQVAEAAALRCVDWFQNPNWALAQGFLPPNRALYKVDRFQFAANVGKYKSNPAEILFDKPFRSTDPKDRLYGTENNPDVWLNPTTSAAAGIVTPRNVDFLTQFNILLFNNDPTLTVMDNNEGGIITDIRIYAPAVEGGNVNAAAGWTAAASGMPTGGTGFVEGGTRFGVATIRVTASKYAPPCTSFPCTGRVIGTRTVKMTVTEWPFPGPNGPLQTNANLDTSGNIQIHWGKTTAANDMDMAKTFSGIPWANAYDLVHFEHGYDPMWPTGRTSVAPRVATAATEEALPYINELVGQSFPDPWWEMRARGNISGVPSVADPTPYSYTTPSDPTTNRSNWFQLQNQVNFPEQQNVLFPRIDYNFWKQLARSADDQDNVYYLQWAGGQDFRDASGNVRDAQDWIDVMVDPPAGTGPKSLPGFYFFDTQNGLNPQNNGPGVLTPDVVLRGGSIEAKGFWYFNANVFGTKGLGGYDEWVNMPGEPYRDIGYWLVEEDSMKGALYKKFKRVDPLVACDIATGTNCVYASDKVGNKNWDFQDLPWSNLELAKNDIFDFKLTAVKYTGQLRAGGADIPANDEWGLIPFFENCDPGVDCSEPHEPYLNLIYPTVALGESVVDWYNPLLLNQTLAGSSRQTRRPKQTDSAGNPVACVAESTVAGAARATDRARCTSNGYDKDGGLVQLNIAFNGVLYNEGQFDTTGNATYFGSVLAQNDASKAGTPDVYFDERLVKGAWPPGNFGFPRVFVSSEQTDQ